MSVRSLLRRRIAKRGCIQALVLVATVLACSPVQKHSVLDFVFDGVPPYMTPEERARQTWEAAQRRDEEAKDSGTKRRRRFKKLARFTHGPFAANECTRCHDLTNASGFRRDRTGRSALAAADLAEAGRLRMPVDKLCVHCHTDFTSEAPGNEGLWLHGPVASGWCVLCHQPHSSLYPGLLVLDPVARICSGCHEREDLLMTEEHRPLRPEDGYPAVKKIDPAESEPAEYPAVSKPADEGAWSEPPREVVQVVRNCSRCHDPHMGTDRLLLHPRDQWEDPPEPQTTTANLNVSQEDDP